MLHTEENKIIMNEIKSKIKLAEKKAKDYNEIFDPEKLFNVADIIVDNKILIDKVDAIIGKRERLERGATLGGDGILERSIDLIENSDT
jgi:hypothetical protein